MAQKDQAPTSTTPGRMEIVTIALSCLIAGPFFAILLITLPLNLPVKIIVIGIGIVLLIMAPILLVLTFRDSWRNKTIKILAWVNFLLFIDTIISLVPTMGDTITKLHELKLSLLANVYAFYMSICMILVLAAEIAVIYTIFRKYGWRAWVGKPANSTYRSKNG
ncbi:MAG: hypothetical protein MUP49_05235 [Dehalococcoidia bacterium]|nr:hypothetical protein [Dehalococcoidia bacterium]